MTTTLYNVILWSGSHKAAEILYQNAYPLRAADGLPSLDEGIEIMVAAAAALGVKPIISVGHRYNGKHSKHSWESANAIMLEWNQHHIGDVTDAFKSEDIAHLVAPTTAIDKGIDKNRFAVIIPLADEITDTKEYKTVACRQMKDIGRNLLTPGATDYTFLIQPRTDELLVWNSAEEFENDLLDPEYHLSRTGTDGWVVAADYEEGASK